MNNLKGGGRTKARFDSPFAGNHLKLEESQSGIPQRVVHVDNGLAGFVALWIFHTHTAGKVLGNIRSFVLLVRCFKQGNAERVVVTSKPQCDFVGLPVGSEALGRCQSVKEETAERPPMVVQLDQSGG